MQNELSLCRLNICDQYTPKVDKVKLFYDFETRLLEDKLGNVLAKKIAENLNVVN